MPKFLVVFLYWVAYIMEKVSWRITLLSYRVTPRLVCRVCHDWQCTGYETLQSHFNIDDNICFFCEEKEMGIDLGVTHDWKRNPKRCKSCGCPKQPKDKDFCSACAMFPEKTANA